MQLTPSDDDFETHVEVGQMVGERYQINRLLGRGGCGVVYEAENVLIGRKVAIKVLLSHRAYGRSAVRRFAKEARATGNIESDHILDVIDIGTLATGEPYLVMELLLGEDLRQRLDRVGKLSPGQLLPLARQALLGLRAAHQAGIIHRDLKPANIFIMKSKAGRSDFVKLIDFGVSKFTESVSNTSVTKPGAIMGTPVYMSPEQAQGDGPIDSRSDIYAMGVILYESLMGHRPFPGKSYNELLFQIVLKSPIPLDHGIDENFRGIVDKAMARNPDERFQSCEAFIAALDEFSGAQSMRVVESPGVEFGEFSKTAKMPAISVSSKQAPGTVPMAVPRLDELPPTHPAFVAAKDLLSRQPVESVPTGRVEYEEPHSLRSSPSPKIAAPEEKVIVPSEPAHDLLSQPRNDLLTQAPRRSAVATTQASDRRIEPEEMPSVPLNRSGTSLRVVGGLLVGLAAGMVAVVAFTDLQWWRNDEVRSVASDSPSSTPGTSPGASAGPSTPQVAVIADSELVSPVPPPVAAVNDPDQADGQSPVQEPSPPLAANKAVQVVQPAAAQLRAPQPRVIAPKSESLVIAPEPKSGDAESVPSQELPVATPPVSDAKPSRADFGY